MRCIGHTLEGPLPEGSRQDLGRREEGEGSHIRHTYIHESFTLSLYNPLLAMSRFHTSN